MTAVMVCTSVTLYASRKEADLLSTITTTKKKPVPRFGLEPVTGALCIETEINEAHHFIKLLFSTINVEKIQHIAHNVFAGHLPNSMDDSSTGLPSSSSTSKTGVGCAGTLFWGWSAMV